MPHFNRVKLLSKEYKLVDGDGYCDRCEQWKPHVYIYTHTDWGRPVTLCIPCTRRVLKYSFPDDCEEPDDIDMLDRSFRGGLPG